MNQPRVRFAPSPTGALHIGGVRTALYNYLLAKKLKGTFVLRIEDTDQTRYVPGAEAYIQASLEWCGLIPDEGPSYGGAFGPYRQSERKDIYAGYVQQLLDKGWAYYAFDTAEELEAIREAEHAKGNQGFKYDATVRLQLKNSLTMSKEAAEALIASGHPWTVRLKVPADEVVVVEDLIRGAVAFQTNELDDKVLLKSDGMPTYHLANIVDDHLMKITHVIRGEEWLSSTGHHVLLYRAFGWEETMPAFAHLPLILKPDGKGKLSKRDGKRLGIPVFPLSWESDNPEDAFVGFKETGFDPAAVINFLALLGWNSGTEQEIFSLDELIDAFSLEKIGKSGARFDFDKAKWFNEQYIKGKDNAVLAAQLMPLAKERSYRADLPFLEQFCGLMKERVTFYQDFFEEGYYFFEDVHTYDLATVQKKWKPERRAAMDVLRDSLTQLPDFTHEAIKKAVESFMESAQLKFGDVLPILRIAVSGTMKGPAIFEMMELLGKEEIVKRLSAAFDVFDQNV
ncbi:MAG: glutamate--tRNA ligase [Saprospiraceae bacterium]|nr:glutamate--tRNA ligase [Saprospiraceae bacterium]MDP4997974.1 glutamate--tRNA ligase [Saprospiraceae bacterium]